MTPNPQDHRIPSWSSSSSSLGGTDPRAPSPNLDDYEVLEEVHRSTKTVVCRGVRRCDRTPVMLKFLTQPYPSFADNLRFRHQHTIAQVLSGQRTLVVYDLIAYGNGYALVTEDFGAISLKQYCQQQGGEPLPLAQFFPIVLELALALDELHHHQIIHQDIKPANILIHPPTQRVKLADFSLSSRLPQGLASPQRPAGLTGTLPYLSPEQTGRMNRPIDYRSDFYALGVTCFELLTGRLPFTATEPLALIHAHLAVPPPQIDSLNPAVPPLLAAIVAKLLAKNAEDRYQTALGLAHDLKVCWQQVQTSGTNGAGADGAAIAAFDLGQQDRGQRFLIPDRLYGRDQEVAAVLAAFDRAAAGTLELLLVAGFSGIGKTAAIKEVHKPIARQQGYFISGKFDQMQRDVPFFAFLQAFSTLLRQILTEADQQVAAWRTQLQQALGDGAGLLVAVLPELAQVIGESPAPPPLSGSAAQRRYHQLFQQLVGVFATAEHPLVMFLDDLQWADAASLDLMKALVSCDRSHLLIIGAYRDNEVGPTHPLTLMLADLPQTVSRQTLTLAPLSREHLDQWVADTLHRPAPELAPLTHWIWHKTQGNPFFTRQFLQQLYEADAIAFNPDLGRWDYSPDRVEQLAAPEDVVAFMRQRLGHLPNSTQQVLQRAACLGNQFDLATLALACDQPAALTLSHLGPALTTGLVIALDSQYQTLAAEATVGDLTPELAENLSTISASLSYRFLHDRVQQAAYSLIAPADQPKIHFHIGQVLLRQIAQVPASQREAHLFDVLNQLNAGRTLATDPAQALEIAQLNLLAGRKAKQSTAYQAAWSYIQAGLDLLPVDTWQAQPQLTLSLATEAVSLTYLLGDYRTMQQWADQALSQTPVLLDQIPLYDVLIQAFVARNRLPEAIALGLDVLNQLGLALPPNFTPALVGELLAQVSQARAERSSQDLLDLPISRDPAQAATLQIGLSIAASAYVSNPLLYTGLMLKLTQVSMTEGNGPESTYVYAAYGLILIGLVGDIDSGYAFGQLAIDLLHKLDARAFTAKTHLLMDGFIRHWREPLVNTLSGLRAGYLAGANSGDPEFSAYSAYLYASHRYYAGHTLAEVDQDLANYSQGIRQLNQQAALAWGSVCYQAVKNLLGQANGDPTHLRGEFCQEDRYLQAFHTPIDQPNSGPCFLYFHRLILCCLFGQMAAARELVALAKPHLVSVVGLQVFPLFHFYGALALLRDSQPEDNNWQLANTYLDQLTHWAAKAPGNYAHRRDLVMAERCRILGDRAAALEHYDHAIATAEAAGYQQDAALANELAAQFYFDWGKLRVGQSYLLAAYYGYGRWGARAKVAQLEQDYEAVLGPILTAEGRLGSSDLADATLDASINPGDRQISGSLSSSPTSGTRRNLDSQLDLDRVLQAAQSISREIELDRLMTILLTVVMEVGGADKCALVLPIDSAEEIAPAENDLVAEDLVAEDLASWDSAGTEAIPYADDWQVAALAQTGAEAASPGLSISLAARPLAICEDCIPVGLVRSVSRSQATAVINHGATQADWLSEPYVQQHRPPSMLCTPILQQGQLLGLLYLENSLTAGAFTADRLDLLQLLCVQAAISLENAQLYQRTQVYAERLEQSLAQLQASESRFQQVAANVPGMIYQFQLSPTGETSFPYVSNGSREIYGLAPEAIQANASLPFVAVEPTQALALQDSIQASAANLTPWDWQGQVYIPSGQLKWIHARSQPERLADGSVLWNGVIFDVSERKRVEAAVQQKNQELAEALDTLKSAQLQLVQSEKMSALGNLVAGVAHEINNPVGFLAGNLQPAKDYAQDLFGLIDLYRQTFPQPGEVIEEELEAIDLDYLREDFPKLLESMNLGIDRIRSISTSLRTFSRADKDHKVPFDLHEGLDSTLLILKHRLKGHGNRPAIEVVCHYAPELPLVEGFPGQMNQVFMNLLANAIDALEEASSQRSSAELMAQPQQITLTTSVQGDWVEVAVIDNGPGMDEATRQQVFDHLFTTKPVGKGTGLGLAIVSQIVVEKHGGTVDVVSAPGAGATFRLKLPLKPGISS
jgi:predicted ATPase/signal transduction histidine kinase